MAPARRSAAQPTEPKKPIPGPIDANHAAPARDRSGAGAGPSGGADVSAMAADELAWRIAAHRATVFPWWFTPLDRGAPRHGLPAVVHPIAGRWPCSLCLL